MLSLIFGTTVSAWQAVRASTAESQANANEQKAVANEAHAKEKANEAAAQRDEAQKQRDEVRALAERLQRTLYASNMNLLTLKGGGFHDGISFSPDGNWLVSDVGGRPTIWDATPLPEKP